ncbi:MAG: diaminopimelate decarboxylase, partial [Clostridia bacterium]|nr:diaminopimelate decarboxylase [Clostridia bacterium]
FLSSNTLDNDYYPILAGILMRTAKELSEKTGLEVAFINLSGGVGIPYRPEDEAPDILKIGEEVHKVYASIFGSHGPAIKTELGRWMTGPEGWLVTHATHHKDTYRHYIGLDACAANLIRPAMYGAYHHITVVGKEDLPHDHIYDVTGSLCENNDKFAIERPLPEIKEGDLVLIHDSGAHGHAMGYNYNGRLRSAEVLYTQDGSFRLIRRAETPQDYFATLDLDPVAGALGLK